MDKSILKYTLFIYKKTNQTRYNPEVNQDWFVRSGHLGTSAYTVQLAIL
jgi:hypothetical protein